MKSFYAWSVAEHAERPPESETEKREVERTRSEFREELDNLVFALLDVLLLSGTLESRQSLLDTLPRVISDAVNSSVRPVASAYRRRVEEVAAAASRSIEPVFLSATRDQAANEFVSALSALIRTKGDEPIVIEVPGMLQGTVAAALKRNGLQADIKSSDGAEVHCSVGDTTLETRIAQAELRIGSMV